MRFALHAASAAFLLAALIVPAPAAAQVDDPDQGDPSGVIYEIPLDNARQDAAPTGGGGGGTGGSGNGGGSTPVTNPTGGTVSPIRSENGFGSSSQVPGAKPGGGNQGGSGLKSTPKTTPATIAPAETLGDPRRATVASSPSQSRAYLLLGLALAVAAGIGVAGRYVARRR